MSLDNKYQRKRIINAFRRIWANCEGVSLIDVSQRKSLTRSREEEKYSFETNQSSVRIVSQERRPAVQDKFTEQLTGNIYVRNEPTGMLIDQKIGSLVIPETGVLVQSDGTRLKISNTSTLAAYLLEAMTSSINLPSDIDSICFYVGFSVFKLSKVNGGCNISEESTGKSIFCPNGSQVSIGIESIADLFVWKNRPGILNAPKVALVKVSEESIKVIGIKERLIYKAIQVESNEITREDSIILYSDGQTYCISTSK
eukprot:TRINITY_DN4207_c0_g1_i3.p1 TRINITY_DN4207_c0_g1~~TRINITY_DN4207_c0_g1_i3.p1  ORF type:complete len:256 (-),score=14.06 TRINITY_DN4207_c0_g1_i3:130-897(-)